MRWRTRARDSCCFLRKTAVTGQENVFLGFRGRKRYSECHGDPVFPSPRNRFAFYARLRKPSSWSRLVQIQTSLSPCTRGKINWCFTPCFSIRGKRSIIRFRSICCSGTRDQSAQPLASEKFDSLFRVVRIRFAYRCSFTLSIFICFEITGPDNGTVAQSTNEGDTWRPGMR